MIDEFYHSFYVHGDSCHIDLNARLDKPDIPGQSQSVIFLTVSELVLYNRTDGFCYFTYQLDVVLDILFCEVFAGYNTVTNMAL